MADTPSASIETEPTPVAIDFVRLPPFELRSPQHTVLTVRCFCSQPPFKNKLTGEQIQLSMAEMRNPTELPKMAEYNESNSRKLDGQPITESYKVVKPTELSTKASALLDELMQCESFESDGVRWTAKDGEFGNLLELFSSCEWKRIGAGFSDYEGVVGEGKQTVEQTRKLQRDNTLRVKKTAYKKLVTKRNALQKEGLTIEDIDSLKINRPGAAFVIACAYSLEEMADGRVDIDFHFVNSMSGLAAFGWHIDDHAEADQKKFIDRSRARQLSPGPTSMFIAGVGEIEYPGQGGYIDFPGWALHRTGKRGDINVGVMWKLVSFGERPKASSASVSIAANGIEENSEEDSEDAKGSGSGGDKASSGGSEGGSAGGSGAKRKSGGDRLGGEKKSRQQAALVLQAFARGLLTRRMFAQQLSPSRCAALDPDFGHLFELQYRGDRASEEEDVFLTFHRMDWPDEPSEDALIGMIDHAGDTLRDRHGDFSLQPTVLAERAAGILAKLEHSGYADYERMHEAVHQVLHLCGALRNDITPLLDSLLSRLRAPDEELSHQSAHWLQQSDVWTVESWMVLCSKMPLLVDCLRDQRLVVRKTAVQLLPNLETEVLAPHVDAIVAVLNDSEASHRRLALMALDKLEVASLMPHANAIRDMRFDLDHDVAEAAKQVARKLPPRVLVLP